MYFEILYDFEASAGFDCLQAVLFAHSYLSSSQLGATMRSAFNNITIISDTLISSSRGLRSAYEVKFHRAGFPSSGSVQRLYP